MNHDNWNPIWIASFANTINKMTYVYVSKHHLSHKTSVKYPLFRCKNFSPIERILSYELMFAFYMNHFLGSFDLAQEKLLNKSKQRWTRQKTTVWSKWQRFGYKFKRMIAVIKYDAALMTLFKSNRVYFYSHRPFKRQISIECQVFAHFPSKYRIFCLYHPHTHTQKQTENSLEHAKHIHIWVESCLLRHNLFIIT